MRGAMDVINLHKLADLCSIYQSKTKELKIKTQKPKDQRTHETRDSKSERDDKDDGTNDGIAYSAPWTIVDTTALQRCAIRLNRDFDQIERLISNQLPIIYKSNDDDVIKYLQPDDILSSVTDIIKMPRDAVFLLMMSVNVNKPIPCPEDIQQGPAILSNAIIRPPEFQFGNLTWSPGQHRPIPKWRYIYNFEVKSAMRKVLSVGKSNKGTDIQREANLVYMLITKVLNQTRGVNISRLVMAQILTHRIRPIGGEKNFTIHHCHLEINPAVFYFQQLFEGHCRWPFLDSATGMVYTNKDPCSTQKVLLLYSILNRGLSWTMGVVTTGFFNLAMKCFYEWAITSLDDQHLLQKGVMNSVTKLLNECVSEGVILTYNKSGLQGVRKLDSSVEFWIEGEKDDLLEKVLETKTTRPYFDTIKELMQRSFSRDELIQYRMALECCTNNSTFKKSSPTLEYDRSAEHKIRFGITQPHAELSYEGFAVRPRFEGTLKLVWDDIHEYIDRIREGMAKRNFEEEFSARLTNNSAGLTTEMIADAKRNNPLLKSMPSIPYGQRYVTSLVDNFVLYNKASALEDITSRVKAGKREQNDRRSRWIMMVSNVLQAAFSVALSFGKEMTKYSKFIASGKQVGDIRDMLQQLRATADANSIIADNDIKSMDASTQEQVSNLVLNAVFTSLDGLDIDRFFYASAMSINCTKYDERGNAIGVERVNLNAVQVFLLDIIGHMRFSSFEFTEGWMSVVTYLSGAIFWSGAFHTAVQHNVFLNACLDVLYKEVTHAYRTIGASFNGAVLGDDISIEMLFNQRSNEVDEAARNIIKQFQKHLKDAGFDAEPESSRFQATFLQQSAIMGGCKPKFARLSPFVAENENSRSKDPFGQIKEIGDILDEMSARAPHPEKAVPVLNALWSVARIMDLKKGVQNSQRFPKRLSMISDRVGDYSRWMRTNGEYMTLVIPYVALQLPEVFGVTPPPMYLYGLGLMSPSFFMPKGTFTYWYLSRALYKDLTGDDLIQARLKQTDIVYKDLERKVVAGLLKPEQADNLKAQPIYLPLHYYVDSNLAFKLGYSFGQWLFNVLPKTTRLAEKDVKHPTFSALVSIGKNKLDQGKVGSSALAYATLLDNGIRIPEGITYYEQPRARLTQAFVLKNEKSRRYGLENESVIDAIFSLVKNGRQVKFAMSDYSLVNFAISESTIPIELSSDASLLSIASLGGCAQKGSLTSDLAILFGTPFGTPSRDVIVDQLKGELTVGADVDLILKEANRINRIAPEHLETFFTAVGIDESSFQKVRRYVSDYSQFGLIEYQSILNVRKYFYMSTHTSASSRLCILSSSKVGKLKWQRLQRIIARDYFFAFPETKNMIKIHPHQSLIDRLVRI
nr:MAG: putative RNA-dependent RNA polymerase [Reoviridae sp.]